MTDRNISILSRLLQPVIDATPGLADRINTIRAAADSDGIPNEEDSVLTESEATGYVAERVARREQFDRFRGFLTRERSRLVGDLERALGRVGEGTSARRGRTALRETDVEELRTLLTQFNAADGNERLSAEDINALIARIPSGGTTLTVEGFLTSVDRVLSEVETIAHDNPLAFVPLDSADRERTLALDWLHNLPEPMLNQLLTQEAQNSMAEVEAATAAGVSPPPHPRPGELTEILGIAGLIPLDYSREIWELTYEQVTDYYNSLPPEELSHRPTPDIQMAEWRLFLSSLQEAFAASREEVEAEGRALGAEGVDLTHLHELRAQLMPRDPLVRRLLNVAGEDHILSHDEAAAAASADPSGATTAESFMAGAERLANQYRDMTVEEASELAHHGLDEDQFRAWQTLAELERMRLGFTYEDAFILEHDTYHNLRQAWSWAWTLGGNVSSLWGERPMSAEDYFTNQLGMWVEMPGVVSGEDDAAIDLDSPEGQGLVPGEDLLVMSGPGYLSEARRELVAHDRRRRAALERLAQVLGLPAPSGTREWGGHIAWGEMSAEIVANPDPDFVAWLETRPEGERGHTIPNALEFLHTHTGGAHVERDRQDYRILTGVLFQAERIWNIFAMSDRAAQEEALFQFAMDLDGSNAEDIGTVLFGLDAPSGEGSTFNGDISNQEYATAIVYFLMNNSENPEMRLRAEQAWQDVLGMPIRDAEGTELEPGGGEFGLVPPWNWTYNYPTRNIRSAASDTAVMVGALGVGWLGTRLFNMMTNATGRYRLWTGLWSMLGQNAALEAPMATRPGVLAGITRRLSAAVGLGRTPAELEPTLGFFGEEIRHTVGPTMLEVWSERVAAAEARRLTAEATAVAARAELTRLEGRSASAEALALARSSVATAERELNRARRSERWLTEGVIGGLRSWYPRAFTPVQLAFRRGMAWHPSAPAWLRAAGAEGETGVGAWMARRGLGAMESLSLMNGRRILGNGFNALTTVMIGSLAYYNVPRYHGVGDEIFDMEYAVELAPPAPPEAEADAEADAGEAEADE